MTFSVLGTDGHAVGIALSSSSPAVAARCIHLRPGVGGAASQNVTDPRLGPAVLDAMASGASPQEALDRVVAPSAYASYRQVTALELSGRSAVFSGSHALGTVAERAETGVVVAGNMLAGVEVVDAVTAAFSDADGELELRLAAALEAGLAAGGEAGPLHSAGLAVVREAAFRETDLRVDWSERPIADLRALLEVWMPQRDDYLTRALRPGQAPGYGVPGDR